MPRICGEFSTEPRCIFNRTAVKFNRTAMDFQQSTEPSTSSSIGPITGEDNVDVLVAEALCLAHRSVRLAGRGFSVDIFLALDRSLKMVVVSTHSLLTNGVNIFVGCILTSLTRRGGSPVTGGTGTLSPSSQRTTLITTDPPGTNQVRSQNMISDPS